MATITNPVFGMLPTMNPTGNQISLGSVPGTTMSPSGSNPLLPNVNLSTSSSGGTNPLGVVPGASPTFPANAGGYPSSTNLTGGTPGTSATGSPISSAFGFGNLTQKDQGRLFNDLKKTYGDGMAHLLMDFLSSGAGYNQQAVNNLLASLQPGIERGTESLVQQFSTMGDRFSSGAEIGVADYLSQVNLNEGQLVTQMYESALNNFMDVMMGTAGTTAQRKMSSPSLLDSILGGLGIAGQGAGAASGIISAIAPGADTGVLDAISGALAFA